MPQPDKNHPPTDSEDAAEMPADPADKPGAGASAAGRRSAILGATFLMATAAIGPGFITRTTTFTIELGVAFAFAIALFLSRRAGLALDRIVGVSVP